MAVRVNPKLIDDLEVYGAQDVRMCYHCGNCTAACPFSAEPYIFPRRSMRNLQMGLEKKLESGLEPWLCYYCGECTEQCPRGAEPGETMMSLRRWLTARYDWTGISRMFYRSGKFELLSVIVAALLTGLGFVLWAVFRAGGTGSIFHYDGPNAFMPESAIHLFDWGLAGVLLVLLLSNCARMWWFTLGRDSVGANRTIRVPLTAYISNLLQLPVHFFSQKRYAQCERKRPWAIHLALMLSYVTMLVLIVFFLGYMQSGPAVDWRVHVLGYLATVGLLGTTIYALRGRLKKSEPLYKHSHETDWLFLALLIFVAFTGILQHILHRSGLDVAANVTYIVHLMGVVPMLGLEVPFSKWAHLAYRPLGMYFSKVRAAAQPAYAPRQAGEAVLASQKVVV
jgi:quinone-modifying oxidoreductase, subunit QmoC